MYRFFVFACSNLYLLVFYALLCHFVACYFQGHIDWLNSYLHTILHHYWTFWALNVAITDISLRLACFVWLWLTLYCNFGYLFAVCGIVTALTFDGARDTRRDRTRTFFYMTGVSQWEVIREVNQCFAISRKNICVWQVPLFLDGAPITLSTSCQSISIYLGLRASRIPTSIVRLSVPILAYATSCCLV